MTITTKGTTTMTTIIEIETTCGRRFNVPVSEMSDRQLKGLLRENEDRPDVDPSGIAAMREELSKRTKQCGG
jgi:hypothetical protein